MIGRILIRLKNTRFLSSILVSCLLIFSIVYYINNNYSQQALDARYLQSEQAKEAAILQRHLAFLNTSSENQLLCVHPKLELWTPAVMKHYVKLGPLKCNQSEKNWVYTENGFFYISSEMAKLHGGNIECDVVPIHRLSDDENIKTGDEALKNVKNGSILTSDIFEAQCTARDGNKTSMLLVGVVPKQEVKQRAESVKEIPKSSLGLDILILGFDSVSHVEFRRRLPKIYESIQNSLGAVVLEGYNIVGDGTTQNLSPLLTGKTEEELPEGRQGFPFSKPIDNYPWIWNDFKRVGYATQWGEDAAYIGTFTMRQKGFYNTPVDHYMRPYYIRAEKEYKKHQNFCFGSVSRLSIMFNYMRDFCNIYSKQRKFSFIFHNEYTHTEEDSKLRYAEEELMEHLKYLQDSGYLDNAILIIMSDHGLKFQLVRSSEQGKYEERMPFFSIRLPESIKTKYPEIAKNLKLNANRLTTPFDIHATLKHILDYKENEPKLSEDPSEPLPRAISLFREIPRRRSCSDAGVLPHWCSCLTWEPISLNSSMVAPAVVAVVDKINLITASERELCHELKVKKIVSAVRYTSSDSLLKFRKSVNWYLRAPEFTDTMNRTKYLYQVTFLTEPNDAKYEATVSHAIVSGDLNVDDKSISRINRYGDQPHCVIKKVPHMRPYCYCKVQLNSTAIS